MWDRWEDGKYEWKKRCFFFKQARNTQIVSLSIYTFLSVGTINDSAFVDYTTGKHFSFFCCTTPSYIYIYTYIYWHSQLFQRLLWLPHFLGIHQPSRCITTRYVVLHFIVMRNQRISFHLTRPLSLFLPEHAHLMAEVSTYVTNETIHFPSWTCIDANIDNNEWHNYITWTAWVSRESRVWETRNTKRCRRSHSAASKLQTFGYHRRYGQRMDGIDQRSPFSMMKSQPPYDVSSKNTHLIVSMTERHCFSSVTSNPVHWPKAIGVCVYIILFQVVHKLWQSNLQFLLPTILHSSCLAKKDTYQVIR